MRARVHLLILSCVFFSGCGTRPGADIGFINETQHPDAQLRSLWKAAQINLSRQIDLNPLQRQFSAVVPDILPGDSRAMSVSPHQLVVSSQPDVTSSALYAATGTNRPDPTGLIVCPQPCNVSYAAAYSLYSRPASHYAASWEFAGNNFDALVQYEFENQILKTLGYDMTWR
ncbi:MAG TPA: hypothetical protein VHQ22_02940 [Terriglobales bacterium]|jgi:hypothetical protein|nr:hypothetical protein [Terriglobales bacterium]